MPRAQSEIQRIWDRNSRKIETETLAFIPPSELSISAWLSAIVAPCKRRLELSQRMS